MVNIPVNKCPDVELIKLPHELIYTYDRVQVKLGSVIYFRFAPGPKASEYVVISERAPLIARKYRIVVVGSNDIVSGMNPLDFVADKKLWWDFYKKRYT
jgi:hypothetical protein